MNGRACVAAAALAATVWLGPNEAAGQAAAGRTAWGDPDLQGVWNYSVDTPLNRPVEFEQRVDLTLEEAAEREQVTARRRHARDNRAAATEAGPAGLEGAGGNYNRFWTDAKRTAQQTSLVVDPADGRVPPLTPAAERWYADVERTRQGVDMDSPTPGGFVEDLGPRGLFTRCILGFNSGPPMSPCCYNENVQIFQTPDHVVLLNEMVHSARIVPLDGRPRLAAGIRQWLGDSRGRWEDDTLVVTTTNFTDAVLRLRPDAPARDRADAGRAGSRAAPTTPWRTASPSTIRPGTRRAGRRSCRWSRPAGRSTSTPATRGTTA